MSCFKIKKLKIMNQVFSTLWKSPKNNMKKLTINLNNTQHDKMKNLISSVGVLLWSVNLGKFQMANNY